MGYLDIISWFFFLPVKFYCLFLTISKIFLGSITNLTLSIYFLFKSLIRFLSFLFSWDFTSWTVAFSYLVIYSALFYLYSSILRLSLLAFQFVNSLVAALVIYLETPIKVNIFPKNWFMFVNLNSAKTLYYRIKK